VSLVGEPCVNHAVERDAPPGQLAVRFDEIPSARTCLGPGSGAVGGPRFQRAADASGGKDRCSNNAELLRYGSPPALDVDDPDLENGSCKTESALGANSNSVWRTRHDCCSRNELDGDRAYAADFVGTLAA